MRRRSVLALILSVGAAGAAGLAVRTITPPNVASVRWNGPGADFGGWSGIDVSPDGATFWAVGDRGEIARGRLIRRDGRLSGVRTEAVERIPGRFGPENLYKETDAEGLSVQPDGSFVVSYEGFHRIWRHAGWGSRAEEILPSRLFGRLRNNASFEAVAVDGDGAIYTLIENPGRRRDSYPVFRHTGTRWDQPFSLARDGFWSAVGADFGPDGAFYLLERRFLGPGFDSRVRRFDFTSPQEPKQGVVVYRSLPGRHGNLEGIAVWRDPDGFLRAVMVTDDNFMPFQRQEIVEVVLPR